MLRKISLSKISIVAVLAAALAMPVFAYARGGGGGGHMGGMGHMGSVAHMGGIMGPRGGVRSFGPMGWHRGDFHRHAAFFPHHRFHRHFFVSNVFFFGGYPYYYGDCYWLRRQAIITGSRYWWARYEACLGYY